MLREEGIVVGLEGEFAVVANQRKKTCGSCHAEAGCDTLSGGMGKKVVEFRAHNPIQAEIGDRVMLEIDEGHFLRASFLVYGVPIISMMFAGSMARSLALAMEWGYSESIGAVTGLLALVLSFYGLSRYNHHIRDDTSKQPVISRILSEETENSHDACSTH